MPRPGGIFFGFCRTRPPPGKYVLSAMGLPVMPGRPAIGTVAVMVLHQLIVSRLLFNWAVWIDRSQRFDYPALGNGAATALADDAVKFAPQSLQIGKLAIDFREVVACDDIDSLTGSLFLIREAQKLPHLLQTKSQIAGTADEAQPTEILFPVRTIVSGRPIRRGKQSYPLVIADSFHLGAGGLGQIADRENA